MAKHSAAPMPAQSRFFTDRRNSLKATRPQRKPDRKPLVKRLGDAAGKSTGSATTRQELPFALLRWGMMEERRVFWDAPLYPLVPRGERAGQVFNRSHSIKEGACFARNREGRKGRGISQDAKPCTERCAIPWPVEFNDTSRSSLLRATPSTGPVAWFRLNSTAVPLYGVTVR
jgi:hypothetical protein